MNPNMYQQFAKCLQEAEHSMRTMVLEYESQNIPTICQMSTSLQEAEHSMRNMVLEYEFQQWLEEDHPVIWVN